MSQQPDPGSPGYDDPHEALVSSDSEAQHAVPEGSVKESVSPKAILTGLLLSVLLVALGGMDPLGFLFFSGLLTAAGLYVSQNLSPFWGSAALAGAAAIGFFWGSHVGSTAPALAGGIAAGAALAVAGFYPILQTRLRREDDHFYVIPIVYWLFLGAGLTVAFAIDRTETMAMLKWVGVEWENLLKDSVSVSGEMMLEKDDIPPVIGWMMNHKTAFLLGSLLAMQALVGYFAIKWVRFRLRWANPVWGRFILFRVNVDHSFFFIGALLLLIAAPYVSRVGWPWLSLANMENVSVVLLLWFFSGCLLAGLAYMGFMIISLRFTGRLRMAQFYQMLVILMAFLMTPVFLMIAVCSGLVDIWFDMRKLIFTNRLFFGKGDS